MAVNTLHTPASLANEAYKFLEHKKIGNVATLIVGYSGKVPEIYKVQWASEIDRVEFPHSDGVKRIDKFVAIGSGAPYACEFLDQTSYAPDMPREKVKNFCQDALIHASLCDYLTRGGGGGANELYLAIQEEFSDNEGPFPINDDVAGTWVEIGQGENEPLQCFLCEDTEGVLNVLLSYDPNNPYKNND
ncbi:PREDICTED: uncharacterized protein [Prunus dulcis]|uniref:PREDICTED: uncharacterized protein n=1 Tax=Prunus dulcis TaxID=3755 RepID=A0A5E4GN38_PRUDU|nr:hypothetical protein L3X38_003708 [Prunus dulcis]VVA41229.1 PREDICTED: uncharacterized protein [Prunus dulcis]